jgi:thioesterase domain-containing protein
MSVIEARNEDDDRRLHCAQTVRDASADARINEPDAKPLASTPDSAVTNSRPSADDARAFVWTGILGAAKHIAKRAPLPLRQRPSVVQLKQGCSETPLYFIGAGLYELHIAQLMPAQHSIYAVEIAWPSAWHDAAARNDTEATPILEDMVALYVAALSDHLGSTVGATPCVLAGYSFHASMAFEIAHQLQDQGVKVELVMLLDAPAEYPAYYKIAWKNLRDVWTPASGRNAAGRTPRSVASRFAISPSIVGWGLLEAARFVKRRFVETALRDPGELTTKLDTLGRPIHWRLIERLYANSLRSYRLRRLDCRGVVFRADRAEDCPSLNVDYSLGWNGLFGKGLEIVQVAGDHLTMMREHPYDLSLAQEMRDAVERNCAKPEQRAPLTVQDV